MRCSRWLPLVVLVALSAIAVTPQRLPAPDAPGRIPGLAEPVRVLTDRHGFSHVEARSLTDLYRAWGALTAQDRLWQLVLLRAQSEGRTHRWFGNQALEADGGAQLLRIAERSRAIWDRERSDPALRDALEAYAAGINAVLAECRAGTRPWPPELVRLNERPRDWEPADTYMVLLGLGLTLDLTFDEISEQRAIERWGRVRFAARRRFEGAWGFDSSPWPAASRPSALPATGASLGSAVLERAATAVAFIPPREADGSDRASNVFAVGPRRSASGRPVLANDPHLALQAPGYLHVVHLHVPGVLDVAGAAVPGLPVVVSGRNRAVAWGLTALGADVVDIVADSLSSDRRRVRTASGWAAVEERGFDLSYRVLGVPIPVPAFVQRRRYTPTGPVLVWAPEQGKALTLRWSAFEDARITLTSLVGLERVRDAREFATRVRTLVTPTINVVAADTLGTVLYQTAGLVPKRWGMRPAGVAPGAGQGEWRGMIPRDSMPAWSVPADAYVVNANNRPVADGYPYAWWGYDFAADRARRIHQRLAGDARVTARDLMSVQADAYSLAGERQTPALLAAADSVHATLSPRARAALEHVRRWDGMARKSSTGAAIARAWWGTLLTRHALGGVPGLALAGLEGRADSAFGIRDSSRALRPAEASVAALETALDSLTRRMGPEMSRWSWGRVHQARFQHALSRLDGRGRWEPPLTPCDGDGSTPCVGRSALPDDHEVRFGPVLRHVVDLAVPESSWVVVPPYNRAGGESMRLRWARHDHVGLLFDWSRVEQAAVERAVWTPAR